MVRCGNCEENILTDSDGVSCSACSRKLHFPCTTITARTFRGMSVEQKKIWKCQYCRSRSTAVGDQAAPAAIITNAPEPEELTDTPNSDLKKDIIYIKETLKEYTRSVEFISRSYDDMKETIKNNNELLLKLTGQITELKTQCELKDSVISNMQRQINYLEQEVIKNNIEITNIPYKNEEDLVQIVKTVGESIGTQINSTDIDNIYRTNTRNTTKDSKIIVSFTSTICKMNVLKQSRVTGSIKLQNITDKLMSHASNDRQRTQTPNRIVYINSQLTAANRHLMWLAKNKAQSSGWKFVWSRDGKILARKGEGTPVVRIVDVDDVCKIT